ncbi:hypothetical protein [Homoserinibacter sp. GY 40078]|uniref:hypothetical protein n=1 Tax=Homoserinibacter sp. GY 40078 TaxID=2603275 RepID=UPI0011CB71DE|nr:hypothetical protein [Homoserinibacter sp. GY 40078]TXK19482.1 hypothetical protein FVQ89_06220 [Homoserinibacter sp. GY 40078]
MKITRKTGLAAIAASVAVIAGFAGLSATAAQAADTPPQFYLLNGSDGSIFADGTVMQWTTNVVASPGPSVDDLPTPFVGSSDATGATMFVATRGQENNISGWVTTYSTPLIDGNIVAPNLTLDGFLVGNYAGVKAGGDYSLGFAFTKNNGVTIADAGVKFVHISVQSGGAGNWTFDDQTTSTDPEDPCVTDPESCQTEDIALSAETLAAEDAGLTLAVAANAATIGDPELVDGISVSTGTLPAITIHDARIVSHPGWTLTSTVTDFTNGTDTIAKSQLGIKPTKASGPSGVAAGAEQLAGSAVYPSTYAEADASATVGDSVLGGDLTFVAPVGKPAGTYTSTLTLTLISK